MRSDAVAPAARRVAALCEPGRAGVATLRLARELAEHDRTTLTVLGVAPQAPAGNSCGMASPAGYNEAVRDAVAAELQQAHEQLGPIGERATFKLLIEGADPPLHEWLAAGEFDVVLLPAPAPGSWRRAPSGGAGAAGNQRRGPGHRREGQAGG